MTPKFQIHVLIQLWRTTHLQGMVHLVLKAEVKNCQSSLFVNYCSPSLALVQVGSQRLKSHILSDQCNGHYYSMKKYLKILIKVLLCTYYQKQVSLEAGFSFSLFWQGEESVCLCYDLFMYSSFLLIRCVDLLPTESVTLSCPMN